MTAPVHITKRALAALRGEPMPDWEDKATLMAQLERPCGDRTGDAVLAADVRTKTKRAKALRRVTCFHCRVQVARAEIEAGR